MIKFEVSACFLEGNPQSELEAIVCICAALRIAVDGQVVVDDDAFPVAELALALREWDGVDSFVYESMEADVPPLALFNTRHGYFVASPLAGTCSKQAVASEALASEVADFIERVRAGVGALGWPGLLGNR